MRFFQITSISARWREAGWGALIALMLSATSASSSLASVCGNLRFIPVKPKGYSKLQDCDSRFDRHHCQIQKGYSRFGLAKSKTGQKAYRIQRAEVSSRALERYIEPLENSPAIRELNELRVRARILAEHPRPCEPNYIYVGEQEVFGVGPAFVSSTRFNLENSVDVTNLIVAEDAKAPYHIPIRMLSKDSLRENNYYDIVIAHEIAHGLMQDLYGIDHFAKLESRVVSRDGHFASAITDPTLAWIEGFAEAFEAYLGEKYLSSEEQTTPYLDHVMRLALERGEQFEELGWGGYLFTIPGTVWQSAKLLRRLDDFVTDFLKAERQQAIRDNHYVLQGSFNNLVHKYGFGPALSEVDFEALADWTPESHDSIFSKEGVAAHFLYVLLREGFANEIFETIRWGKPTDLWDFAEMFRQTVGPEGLKRFEDLYKSVFTLAGRRAVRMRLKGLSEISSGETPAFDYEGAYRKRIDAIPMPSALEPPRDMFVEFWNPAFLHRKINGRMDRINLATATPGRVEVFLKTLHFGETTRKHVLVSFLDAREWLVRAKTVEEFTKAWTQQARDPDVARAAERMLLMRGCYLKGCLSKNADRFN